MSFAIWITGIPGSGKTTIAKELCSLLGSKYERIEHLRLDEIRKEIVPDPKYTDEEREFVYRSLALSAHLLVKHGVVCVIDGTDNLGVGRKSARMMISDLHIVQVICSVETAMKREESRTDKAGMKDLYKRAKEGKIKIPGLNDFYAEEKDPKIAVDSEKLSPEESAKAIIKALP